MLVRLEVLCTTHATIPPKMITYVIRPLIQKHFVSKKTGKYYSGYHFQKQQVRKKKKVVTVFLSFHV